MKRTLVQVYALIVCFLSMCASIVLIGLLATGAVEEFVPYLSRNDYFERALEDNDSFWQYYSSMARLENNFEVPKQRPPEDKLSSLREQSRVRFYERLRRQRLENMVGWLTYLAVMAAVFVFHWRVARKLDAPSA